VQRAAGLALGRAQVGLEPPAVAAVGVAVGVERGEDGCRVARTEQQLEAAAIELPGMGSHERASGVQIRGHGRSVPRPARGVLKISAAS
jgi:hypothetical protein